MSGPITIQAAVAALDKEIEKRFVTLMQHGTMSVEYYAPHGIDPQIPHKQNELYIIASGSGIFFRDGERISFHTGDVLFVPAAMEHRFEEFTDDFAIWVIFYGPEGGEQ
jgi:mannose-6-phosphate isomerase-like protein (cupin superfamily)